MANSFEMDTISIITVALLGLQACSEPPPDYTKYNQGRVRAETEGCHCNARLKHTSDDKQGEPGLTWAEGYVEACIAVRKDFGC